MKRSIEDITSGEEHRYGDYIFTEANIIAFARDYDPQPFHLDMEQASDTPMGQLCASGLQVLSVIQRMNVENIYSQVHMVAGRGMRDLRFLRPVLPGDRLSVAFTVTETRLYPSRGQGVVSASCVGLDQSGKAMTRMSVEFVVLMAPRA